MTETKIMVAAASEASNAVNSFIYIIIHHDDLGFVLHHQEREEYTYFVIHSFSKSMMPYDTIMTNIMTKVLSDATENHWISLLFFSDGDKVADTTTGDRFRVEMARC
jgi:hypothetical protein